MASMKDVSKRAGVSIATVSNVITGKRKVSPKVRDCVLAAINELDYQVNYIARGLKTQRTGVIGLVLPDITKLFFQEVLNGIIRAASSSDYRVIIMNSDYCFNNEQNIVSSLVSNYVDGIILDSCAPIDKSKEWAAALADASNKMPPVVSIESQLDAEILSSVTFNNNELSSQVTQHLIDTGRKRILYVSGPITLEHEHARYSGYLRCLKANGIPPIPALQAFGDYLSESGYHLVREKIISGSIFDAVQTSSDQAAIGAIKALQEADIRVPEQVSVCGFDNVFPSSLVSPALTTVDMPGNTLGKEAFKLLLQLIKKPRKAPEQHILEARLLIRGSSLKGVDTEWDLTGW